MSKSFNEQTEHDSLVKMMARYFATLGYLNIRADIEGHRKPESIYWKNRPNVKYIPDLTCNKNDEGKTYVILEAETCDSLTDTAHTAEQWKLFSARARRLKGEFHVVVPRICGELSGSDRAQELADNLEIKITTIWMPSESA